MPKADAALAQLKDIHLPNPVGWWPLAPGWYVLLLLLIVFIVGLIYLDLQRKERARPKKQALQLLAGYTLQYEKEKNAQVTSARISELLRRVALVYFPREKVASLHGESWVSFLNQTGKNIDFKPVQAMLLESPFKNDETVNLSPLILRAELWIKQRRLPCLN